MPEVKPFVLFFIGELFNELSKQEEEYAPALDLIKRITMILSFRQSIEIDDGCIEVQGLSYDQDGIVEEAMIMMKYI